ncbi:hypothetical protein RER83_16520 [Bacillus velezensis]|uniref:hypothetical protein n=1 Tax=Bacillus velezensis TaxID=492670 RepID=UPI002807AEE5|nr:hypothetical protein [Bacillus velezensis]MDQ8057829.1 hypothetical protein [Bacillus velezensis]
MILKTRSNFSIMRIDQSILIKKINGQHQAVLSDEDYKTFIDILAEYRNPKMLSLVNQSNDYLKLFKFALKSGLLIEVKGKANHLTTLITQNIENRFEDFETILEDLDERSIELKGAPEQVISFFMNNGILDDEREQKSIIYFNDNIREAPLKSICIEINESGRSFLFKKKSKEQYDFLKRYANQYPKADGELARRILPFLVYVYVTSDLYESERQVQDTLLLEDGTIISIPEKDITGVIENYERKLPNVNDDELTIIQKLESAFVNCPLFKCEFNSTETSRINQFMAAHYQIDINNDFKYMSTHINYKKAALHTLMHSIEKFLTYESERNKENTLWIADLDKDHFYIRGIASFIKKESSIHLIERIDITAKKLLQTIYHMTEIKEVLIGIDYLFKKDVGIVYLIDEDHYILYKSEVTTDFNESIIRGLTEIISNKANGLLKKGESVELSSFQVRDIGRKRPNSLILAEMLEVFSDYDIKEKPWIYQPLFESSNLLIGSFQLTGENLE